MFFVDLDNVNHCLRCIYVDDNIYKTFPKEIKKKSYHNKTIMLLIF